MSFVVSQWLLTQQVQDMCRMVASHWSGSSFTKCIASLRQDIMRCKKCGSHSASIWVDMHPPCIAPNNLAEIPAIILDENWRWGQCFKKDSRVNDINLSMYQITERPVAGCLMAYHGVWDLQSWCGGQGCDLVLLVVWGCDRDISSPGVEALNDWGFICHLKPHTWGHSRPLCTCTLSHRWKDHVESHKFWRSSPSCLSMRPWPGQVLLVAACWLLGPDLLLPHYVSIAFVENRYKKDIETSPENMLLAHVIAVVQHKFKWDSRHCFAFHCRNLESDSCATRPSSQRFWGWWLHWESWIRSPTAPRKHRTNIDQHWSQGIMSTAD